MPSQPHIIKYANWAQQTHTLTKFIVISKPMSITLPTCNYIHDREVLVSFICWFFIFFQFNLTAFYGKWWILKISTWFSVCIIIYIDIHLRILSVTSWVIISRLWFFLEFFISLSFILPLFRFLYLFLTFSISLCYSLNILFVNDCLQKQRVWKKKARKKKHLSE